MRELPPHWQAFNRQARHPLEKGWIDSMSTNTAQLLAEIPLFSTMDDEGRSQLRAIMKERSFQPGQVVMTANGQEASFFIVQQGEIEVWLTDADGKKVVLEVLGPGKVFGNLFMLTEETRSANATTSGELVALELGREAFFDFLRRRPDTAIDLLEELGQRLKDTDKILRTRVSRNANEEHDETISLGQRVADLIADFSGTLAFLLLNLTVFVVWIVVNTLGPAIWHFDPFPFQFLTMSVSLEAIFLSIFVLISQNRQAAKDRIKADLDYQVNVKTELELSAMTEHIRDIEQKLQHMHHDVLEARGGNEGEYADH
jgi:CRP/FNR family transcriptional regulator, cyclic AMP receptor protein